MSPATVNIRTRTLKCFLRFLHDEGYLQTDLASRIKLQKVAEDTIGAFENEQVLQLLAAPNQREYTGFRDYVLLTMLFDTGLRINEALNLTVDDLNLTGKTITVRASVAKKGSSRVVPITKRTAELLAALVKENRKQFAGRRGWARYGQGGGQVCSRPFWTALLPMDKMDKYLNIPQEEQNADPCNQTQRYSRLTLPILPIIIAAAPYGSGLPCPYLARTSSTLPTINLKTATKALPCRGSG
ncbi:tyrosine-type recombinase/integrase [Paenibacillus piri]|uniref:tyrosine-type recombinase/integrase n=1 Tax=Paenibacillus piri TaxID=2547395 RepID=UPI0014053FB0|nr:site-specific integrase [Paenibacillus piri]